MHEGTARHVPTLRPVHDSRTPPASFTTPTQPRSRLHTCCSPTSPSQGMPAPAWPTSESRARIPAHRVRALSGRRLGSPPDGHGRPAARAHRDRFRRGRIHTEPGVDRRTVLGRQLQLARTVQYTLRRTPAGQLEGVENLAVFREVRDGDRHGRVSRKATTAAGHDRRFGKAGLAKACRIAAVAPSAA
jgi:hypothetical protein